MIKLQSTKGCFGMTKSLIKKDGIVFSEEEIAQIMVENAKKQIDAIIQSKNEINILEPSVGDGSLIVELLDYIPSDIIVNVDCLDIHENFLLNTENNLQNIQNFHINYLHQDYIDYQPNKSYDIIISNPPYVRTSTIGSEKSKSLKKQFGLSGKIDLYHAFFVKMISELADNGLLIIITSNKYLYNKTGDTLRQQIFKNLSIDLLIDLGDTKLFDAAVLPAILIGTKSKATNIQNHFISIYENHSSDGLDVSKSFHSIKDAIAQADEKYFFYQNKVFELKRGDIKYENGDILLLDENDHKFIEQVQNSSKFLLKDLASVKVGIKTTADKVFISQEFPEDIEEELIHPIIVSKSIQKWNTLSERKKYIIYPYNYSSEKKEVISLNDYPKCRKYFEQNELTLKKRTYIMESKREWFEIWVPHFPKIWKQEKIVFKDISSHGIFAYDNGSVVNGDSFFIILNDGIDKDYLYLLLGVLNSKTIATYHDLRFPNKLYSNKKRFNSQYVEKYPIPDIQSPIAQDIISRVKRILDCDTQDIPHYEKEINELTQKLYDNV